MVPTVLMKWKQRKLNCLSSVVPSPWENIIFEASFVEDLDDSQYLTKFNV